MLLKQNQQKRVKNNISKSIQFATLEIYFPQRERKERTTQENIDAHIQGIKNPYRTIVFYIQFEKSIREKKEQQSFCSGNQ